MGHRSKVCCGPRRAWYVQRQFTYSIGREIKNRLVTEYLCPSEGKWVPSVDFAYPSTRGSAERRAFWFLAKNPDDIGKISVVCRRVPLKMRYVRWVDRLRGMAL